MLNSAIVMMFNCVNWPQQQAKFRVLTRHLFCCLNQSSFSSSVICDLLKLILFKKLQILPALFIFFIYTTLLNILEIISHGGRIYFIQIIVRKNYGLFLLSVY